ncbi:phenylacetate--CoA ligase family protein [Arthrobacter zhaoxinii]|uniref:phenylacetate--CoA ligase family protein n=1 Tax=Arthrobacter zhaoxinii TaxID=2964616 RepID=UPI0021065F04|nr:CoF synthetase [Arthrobacter zhaoxinii]MCQ1999917.1 CoF synthetase [Arthrobacter zhaoxinii]
MKKVLIFAFLAVQERFVRLFMPRVSTHQLLLLPGIESLRWTLGRWRAWRTFELAAKKVPAYRQFLAKHDFPGRLPGNGTVYDEFSQIPEMDKDSYIRPWSTEERCLGGKLPRRGVVVDESSGSSGVPTSWVRGPDEREATRQLLQLGFARTSKALDKQPFVLNAFSLGAWATGMNVTSSLTDVTMIKSIGPDKDKIIQTMQEFGTGFTYIILSYPPFLKALFEDTRLRWQDYDIVAAFGGEGISENMRAHINKYTHGAFGSYGASDLEINLAIETDFSVALRQAVAEHPKLAALITKQDEYGVLPMIFQFNPYGYLIETNDAGELLVTIVRRENINPRIRYNIHDRGHVMRVRDLKPILREYGLTRVLSEQLLDLPLLFHYGRSDLSVDFNGAVVAPDALRDVIYNEQALLDAVENHRLISYEDAQGNRQLHIALQLNEQATESKELDVERYLGHVVTELRRMNGDFNNAIRTAPDSTLPTVAFYPYRTGPFTDDGRKLKNEYVWQLDGDEVGDWELDFSYAAQQ